MKKIVLLYVFIVLGTVAYAQQNISGGYIKLSDKVYCEDGVLFSKYKYNNMISASNILVKYPQNKQSSVYTIPEWVNTIASGAFQGNKYLKTIKIPSTISYIAEDAFNGCEQLTSIEVYESTSSVRAVETDNSPSEAREVGRYNIQGVKIEEGENGQVQIILYSDGSSKKIIE